MTHEQLSGMSSSRTVEPKKVDIGTIQDSLAQFSSDFMDFRVNLHNLAGHLDLSNEPEAAKEAPADTPRMGLVGSMDYSMIEIHETLDRCRSLLNHVKRSIGHEG